MPPTNQRCKSNPGVCSNTCFLMASASPRSQQTYKTNGAYPRHLLVIGNMCSPFPTSGKPSMHLVPQLQCHMPRCTADNHTQQTQLRKHMAVGSKDSGWHWTRTVIDEEAMWFKLGVSRDLDVWPTEHLIMAFGVDIMLHCKQHDTRLIISWVCLLSSCICFLGQPRSKYTFDIKLWQQIKTHAGHKLLRLYPCRVAMAFFVLWTWGLQRTWKW